MAIGLNKCEPHYCPCGGAVDAKSIHGLSCKRERRSFHTSPANQRSCLACHTQSRHSVCQRTVRCAPRRGQASWRAYTSAIAGWPLLGLGRHCGRHVGTFLCRCQRTCHRQRCAGGWEKSLEVCRSVGISSICTNSHWDTQPYQRSWTLFLVRTGKASLDNLRRS